MRGFFKKNLTIPNIICVARILLLIPFVLLYINKHYAAALSLLVLSGLSDTLDGTLARKLNQVTELGKMLDPVADKVTQITLAVVLLIQFMNTETPLLRTYSWVFVVFLGKELFMLAGGGAMLLLKMRPQPAEIFGKVATVTFYVVMSLLLGFAPEIGAIALKVPALTLPEPAVLILVGLSAVLTVIAFLSYVPGIVKEVKRGFAQRKASDI
ncbi:MAG: CDP-alcohol phosphatidyltransferase family protein [Oscillospiraceae bacterium]|jgi:cardiolipin synthase|nr:CDP-alcohol phosphatidyltransferase family protein [Oscillospiraceae bacterium]